MPTAGTWLIIWRVQYNWKTATTPAELTVYTSLERRNNTAATLGTHEHYTPVIAAATSATLGDFTVALFYTTATAGDILGINTYLSALPGAGSLMVEGANIVAMWAHP